MNGKKGVNVGWSKYDGIETASGTRGCGYGFQKHALKYTDLKAGKK